MPTFALDDSGAVAAALEKSAGFKVTFENGQIQAVGRTPDFAAGVLLGQVLFAGGADRVRDLLIKNFGMAQEMVPAENVSRFVVTLDPLADPRWSFKVS